MPTKTKTVDQLVGDIRYELHQGIHTVGVCQRCKKLPARGCGICAMCRLDELAQAVGQTLANEFYTNTINIINTIYAMQEKEKEKKVRSKFDE